VAFWQPRIQRRVVHPLSVAGLVCVFLNAALSVAADEATTAAPTHKVLAANIRVPLPEDDAAGNGWDARKGMCLDIIEAQHPDVVCLQECRAVQFAALTERFSQFDAFGLSNPGPAYDPANAILFRRDRYELVSAGGFWLSETPHVAGSSSWDSARDRFVNWVDLRVRDSGQQLRVLATHLDHVGHRARAEGARLLVEASQALPENLPQILVGDMNASRRHPAIETLTGGGWVDTYARVHGPGEPGFTFHGFLGPQRAEKLGEKRGAKIDWIFTRGPVETRAAQIIRDGRDGRYPSDHYFISADVVLQP
jgi:endonuclease/exonuclease/phosphatase family metal-dependent hydrolase